MKYICLFILTLFLLFAMVGCDDYSITSSKYPLIVYKKELVNGIDGKFYYTLYRQYSENTHVEFKMSSDSFFDVGDTLKIVKQ